MSILAASICEKNGDLLLSRQFSSAGVAQLRRMEEAYPVLLTQGSRNSALEQDGLRYIFEPLDELIVALVSDADTSNILQDLKTLRLLTQLVKTAVPSSTSTISRKEIAAYYPDIVDAFDEVVATGYPENLTVSQVETFLKMESHEEKIQQIIERNKQLEAAEERKKKAREFDLQRSEGVSSTTGFGSGSNFGSSSNLGSGLGSGMGASASSALGAHGNGSGVFKSYAADASSTPIAASAPVAAPHLGKGLKLGKKPVSAAGNAGMPLLADPEPLPKPTQTAHAVQETPQSSTTDISISEQLTIEMTREGEIKTSRVSGTLNLFAGDREHTRLRIQTKTGGQPQDYKPHPKMDRANFANNRVLSLKNENENLPAANILLAKWTADRDVPVPVNVSCWVSKAADAGFFDVTLEYEVQPNFSGVLEDLTVTVPLPVANAHVADASSNYEQFEDHIVWNVPQASLENEPSGSFEFTAEADAEDEFYPLQVAFHTAELAGPGELNTFGHMDVVDVVDLSTGSSVEFSKTAIAKTASFVIR